MYEKHRNILDNFLAKIAGDTLSIVLVGSHVLGNTKSDSDIDLIILTKNHEKSMIVLKAMETLNQFKSRPLLDCKVYTEMELSKAKAGLDNLFLWTCMLNGQVLLGRDITDVVELNPNRVSESYWNSIDLVESACSNLADLIQYTGSCYAIYQLLCTTYFIDKFIFDSINENQHKSDFLKSVLGSEFKKARDRYYWVIRNIDFSGFPKTLKIHRRVDMKFKKGDYEKMYDKGIHTYNLTKDKYNQIKKWAESSII
ncbi:MAG: nucleotidyltransferase domain-containing protein [Candidatus Thorarchaeota archaeon]